MKSERNMIVLSLLWIALLASICLTIYYIGVTLEASVSILSLGYGLCSMFALLNVLGVILLMRRNKCGFKLLLLSAIVLGCISIFVLKSDPYNAIATLCAVLLLYLIFKFRKKGRYAWSELNPGWDYLHCRHIYQLFLVVEIILFMTAIVQASDKSMSYPQYIYEKPSEGTVVIEPIEAIDSIPADTITTQRVKEDKSTKEESSSIEAAAEFLDTHKVWKESEMQTYPILRGLNRRIKMSIKKGSWSASYMDKYSKRLTLIRDKFYEYVNLVNEAKSEGAEINLIKYRFEEDEIDTEEMIKLIQNAIKLQIINLEIQRYRKQVKEEVDSVSPTFGLG